MGLFDKKYCDVCKEKIGLLGNRKLEDGNLCKSCAAKLSPWFNERRHSTVQSIIEQLAYRVRNEIEVAKFHVTRSFGNMDQQLLIDEAQKKFTICSIKRLTTEYNPDIIDIAKVINCGVDVEEHRTELKTTNNEGKQVSFNPPRYEYEYDFYYNIQLDHPYIDKMRFKLNNMRVKVHQQITNTSSYRDISFTDAAKMGAMQGIFQALNVQNTMSVGNGEYDMYMQMGNSITTALMSDRTPQSAASSAPVSESLQAETAAPAPSGAWICPSCGANNIGKFCESCGTKRP